MYHLLGGLLGGHLESMLLSCSSAGHPARRGCCLLLTQRLAGHTLDHKGCAGGRYRVCVLASSQLLMDMHCRGAIGAPSSGVLALQRPAHAPVAAVSVCASAGREQVAGHAVCRLHVQAGNGQAAGGHPPPPAIL